MQRERATHVRVALSLRQVCLRRCPADPLQRADHWHRKPPGDVLRLVEAARPKPARCSGTGTAMSAPSRSCDPLWASSTASLGASERRASYLSAWTIDRRDPSYSPIARARRRARGRRGNGRIGRRRRRELSRTAGDPRTVTDRRRMIATDLPAIGADGAGGRLGKALCAGRAGGCKKEAQRPHRPRCGWPPRTAA